MGSRRSSSSRRGATSTIAATRRSPTSDGGSEETGLTLNSVHAPITDVFGGHGPRTTYSNAVTANDRREAAVRETEAALGIARTIPFDVLVLHLGTPANMKNADDNHRAAAIRSLDEICRLAEPLGVRVAVEVIPNRLSDAASLVAMLDDELDGQPHRASASTSAMRT